MYSHRFHRLLVTCAVLLAGVAGADTVVYGGRTYTDVSVHETSTRYYFRLPDGTAASISKSEVKAGEIILGDQPVPAATETGTATEVDDVTTPDDMITPVLQDERSEPEPSSPPAEEMVEETPVTPEEEMVEETPVTPEEEMVEETPATPEEEMVEETPATPEEEMVEETPATPEEEMVEEATEPPAQATPAELPAEEEEEVSRATGPLSAGASTVVVSEPGAFDEPLEVNALVLKVGDTNASFVSLDVAALDRKLVRAVTQKLSAIGSELNPSNIFIGATGVHTTQYAGLMSGLLSEAVYGDFSGDALEAATEHVVQALTDAVANLAPAQVTIADADAPDVHAARSDLDATTDSTVSSLLVETAEGAPVAYVVNYALIPPVIFGVEPATNRGAVGKLAAGLRGEGGDSLPVLFFNGAAGDIAADDSADRGTALAALVRTSLEGGGAKSDVTLEATSRLEAWPPTLLEGILPAKTWVREIHVDDAAFLALPQAVAGQVGLLLRVKAQQAESNRVFLCAHTSDFQGYAPSVSEFFVLGPYTQLAYHGPLIMKWYADAYLRGGGEEAWKNIPILGQHATAFQTGVSKGQKDRDTIVATWEDTSTKLNTLVGMIKAFAKDLPDEIRPLVERLDNKTLPIVGKQVAGIFLRGEIGALTEEERAVLMGVSEGAQVPFDAILILYAGANQDKLPDQVKLGLTMAKIQEGYDPLASE